MSINNRLIQDTLVNWLASQMPNLPVYWRNQKVPQAEFPYANLWIRDIHAWGPVDDQSHDFDASRPLGEEIHHTRAGPREIRVDLDVYSISNNPNTDALALGERLKDSLQDEEIKVILFEGGLTYLRCVFSRQMSQIEGTEYVNRYYAEVIFCAHATAVKKTGYIETVVVESDPTNDPDFGISQTLTVE